MDIGYMACRPHIRGPVNAGSREGATKHGDRRLAAANGLRMVREGDGRAGVAGELGDETDLDALGLRRRGSGEAAPAGS